MGTEILDYRRRDLRSSVLENPYWITSGEMTHLADSLAAVFFSFPITASDYSPAYGSNIVLIHEIVLEVATSFTSDSTTFSIGQSAVTKTVTTGDDTTSDTAEMYMTETDGDADIIAAAAFNFIDSASNYLTAHAACTWGTNASIIPHDTTVLSIVGFLAGGTLTAGSAYVHVLISVIPGVD